MAALYVTLIKLDPGAQTCVSFGPFDRVEVEDSDLVGYVGEEPTLIAYILEDGLEAPNADTLYNRSQITIGEPNA
jgi:hypothetical protein